MTKNFAFLMESREFDEKPQLIKLINEIENEAKKEEACDMSKMSNFRHIYLMLLKMYITYQSLDESLFDAEEYEQWQAVIKFCTQKEAHCFKRIKDAGNIGSHGDSLMSEQYDIIHYLKSLYILLKELLLEFNFITNIKTNFDKTCYTGGVDKTKQAFTKNEIQKWDEESTKCEQTFIVQRLPIVQLLSMPTLLFNIPIYQRGYSWQNNHIMALLKDIEKRQVDNLDHYFGVIAYKLIDQDAIFNTDKCLSILDGQQRLTTSAILMCAVRDALRQKGKTNFVDVVARFKNPAGREIDNEAFEMIKCNNISQMSSKHKATNFYKNYVTIYEYLLPKTCDEIIDFYNAFQENFRVGGIQFKMISKKNEMEIFENLNSKGKSLSVFDLTKNFIFNLCSEETLDKSEGQIVQTFNEFITLNVNLPKEKSEKLLTTFFDSLIHYTTGQQLQNNGHDVDQINYLIALDKSLQALHQIYFGETMPLNMSIQQYKKMLKMLARYLHIFLNLYDPDTFELNVTKTCGVKYIYDLVTQTKKKNPLYPSIYLIYDTLKLDGVELDIEDKTKKYIKNCIYSIIKCLIWHDIISGQGDSDTARQFWEITFDIRTNTQYEKLSATEKLDILQSRINKDIAAGAGDWKVELSNVSKISWAHKALLILIEWELMGGINGGIRMEYDHTSWEHVMPQDISKWKEDLIAWNPNIKEDEIVRQHSLHVHKLGNAIRLPRSWNSQTNNKPFSKKQEKLKMLAEFSSPLYKNSNVKIDISQKAKWNFSDIDDRHNELIRVIEQKIFKSFN